MNCRGADGWYPKPDEDGEGSLYAVRGHWGGDFNGRLTYRGDVLAIFNDSDGKEREICYLHGVVFKRLADA
jgi:hypothetical protein